MQTIAAGPEWKGRALSGDYLKVGELLLIKMADNTDNTYYVIYIYIYIYIYFYLSLSLSLSLSHHNNNNN